MLPLFCLSICRSVGKAAALHERKALLRYGPIDRATTGRPRAKRGALCSVTGGRDATQVRNRADPVHMRVQYRRSRRAPKLKAAVACPEIGGGSDKGPSQTENQGMFELSSRLTRSGRLVMQRAMGVPVLGGRELFRGATRVEG